MKPKNRSRLSFALLLLFLSAFYFGWQRVRESQPIESQPRPFRQVLELNGRLWKAIFNPQKLSTCRPPPKGARALINGDIGLSKDFDPSKWSLTVIADDDEADPKSITLTMKDLKSLPRTDTATEFRCIEGWSEEMGFAGVKFSDFMEAYHLKPKKYVGLETTDGEYYVSVDMDSMLHPQTLLAYELNGEDLPLAHGAPLRLVIPVKYGIKNLKRIGKIFFSDTKPADYWAEQGYDWYAGL